MNIYYSILRPVSIGTFPTKGIVQFKNYDRRKYVPEIDHEAWAELRYERKLTRKEMEQYDLLPHPENLEN